MAHPLYHARSSARKYGGVPEDYLAIHNFFDQTKAHVADARHRLILHNSFGIFLCEQLFGVSFKRASDHKELPTRPIAEQHVLEDLGRIPTLEECLRNTPLTKDLVKTARKLSEEEGDQYGREV